jgi:phosphatidate cytidylyltransferase
MLRLLSGLVIISLTVAAVLWLEAWQLLVVAEGVLVLAFVEYARLAEALGVRIPRLVAGAAAMVTCAGLALSLPLELPLLAATISVGALAVGSRAPAVGVLGDVGATCFPMLYLGLPLGAIVALHAAFGARAVLLLLVVIVVSDTAQYYAGRLFGRRKLSPVISPKKTLEGALGGFVVAPIAAVVVARWWLPEVPPGRMSLIALALVGLGIAGDLFESLLKRSAGLKDSSALIPGHGGVLDRIDALLFAAPAFYLFLRYGG